MSSSNPRAFLAEQDKKSLSFRTRRLRTLTRLHGPETYFGFVGGYLQLKAFDEARSAYLHGLDLCAIIASQVCIERGLEGQASLAGYDLKKPTFVVLVEFGVKVRLLTKTEGRRLNRLRLLRNPYVHPRPLRSEDSFERTAIRRNLTFEGSLAKDAYQALMIMYSFIERARYPVETNDSAVGSR